MTSEQLKQLVDSVFVRLRAAAGRHAFIEHAFALVQNFVDDNWAAIFPALPSTAAGKDLVDSLFTHLEGLAAAKGEFAVQMALRVVQGVVDKYLASVLGA